MILYKKVAIQAVRAAGDELKRRYKRQGALRISRKSKHEIVTDADLAANRIIIRIIKKHFPTHDILSEETGFEDNPGEYRWVMDPLDGTTNYALKSPLFCTVLMLLHKARPVVSVTYAPLLEELYLAVPDQGATLNGKKIKVSSKRHLSNAITLLAKCHSEKSRFNEIKVMRQLYNADIQNIKKLGSTGLDFAFVATGRVDGLVVVPPGVSKWDTLAGMLLVREAGGKVTNFDGSIAQHETRGVVASNGYIHRQLLDAISV